MDTLAAELLTYKHKGGKGGGGRGIGKKGRR
jgi:hypothetical protein